MAAFANQFYDEQVQPFFVRGRDSTSLHLLGAGAATAVWARGEDEHVQRDWNNHHLMSESVADVGDKSQTYGLGILIAGSQWFFDHDNGVSHVRALVTSSLVTWTFKYSVSRERPNQANRLSFPSGHTSSAFATATSLAYAYGWPTALVVYPMAAFVGASRLADNEHWFSDVVAGAVVGIYCGRASYFQAQKPATDWTLMPLLQSKSLGLQAFKDF